MWNQTLRTNHATDRFGNYSVVINKSVTDPSQQIYRNILSIDQLRVIYQEPKMPPMKTDVPTLVNYMNHLVDMYGDRDLLGWRNIIKIHEVDVEVGGGGGERDGKEGKKVKKMFKYELENEYQWISYKESKVRWDRVGRRLVGMGVEKGENVLIFAATSPEWLLMLHGCSSQSITVATAYDTMKQDSIHYLLDQTQPRVILVDTTTLPILNKLFEAYPPSASFCRNLISVVLIDKNPNHPSLLQTRTLTAHQNLSIFIMDSLIDPENEPSSVQEADSGAIIDTGSRYPAPQDIAVIMYTSGSTGIPKGVMLSHLAIMAGITNGIDTQASSWDIEITETYLAYLPMAHIMELYGSHSVLAAGSRLGFARVRTLMDNDIVPIGGSVMAKMDGKVEFGVGDLKTLKPSLMGGVPMVWERIQKGILGKVNQKWFPVRWLFYGAMKLKFVLLEYHDFPDDRHASSRLIKFLDHTILKPPRDAVGGRLKRMMCGGTAISANSQQFLYTLFCYCISGYGLTETCAQGAIAVPAMPFSPGKLGPVSTGLEVRFVAVPDTSYTGGGKDGGEIWFRGPALMNGYYQNEEETKKAMTEDGWFKTGDIGCMDENGLMSVKDRIKNLVKLSHGEYVTLDELETRYRTMTDGGIKTMVLMADNGAPCIVAVVEPMDEKSEVDEDKLLKMFQDHAKMKKLSRFETIQKVIVVKEDWTTNGFLTATNKIKRREVREYCSERLERFWEKYSKEQR